MTDPKNVRKVGESKSSTASERGMSEKVYEGMHKTNLTKAFPPSTVLICFMIKTDSVSSRKQFWTGRSPKLQQTY